MINQITQELSDPTLGLSQAPASLPRQGNTRATQRLQKRDLEGELIEDNAIEVPEDILESQVRVDDGIQAEAGPS